MLFRSDEPTAVLTPQEIDELLAVIKNLAASGVGVLFITHKLREVMAIADRVVVLRNGKLVGTTSPKETDEEGLAQMMVGRNVVLRVDKKPAVIKDSVLEVKNLSVKDDRNLMAVNDFSIEVHAGEILGVAGVEGNGQRELVEAICGMRNRESGSVKILGAESPNMNPHDVRLMGLSNIPEDREKDGLVSTYSIAENMVLNQYDQAPFATKGIRNFSERDKYAAALVKEFDVRTPSFNNLASSLSGGNKQKVVVARELSQNSKVIVASQPTRGVDIGSIEFIHNQLVSARDNGAGVLLVSAELDEILSLADRIAVMYEGKVVAIVKGEGADRQHIGRLKIGRAHV